MTPEKIQALKEAAEKLLLICKNPITLETAHAINSEMFNFSKTKHAQAIISLIDTNERMDADLKTFDRVISDFLDADKAWYADEMVDSQYFDCFNKLKTTMYQMRAKAYKGE